VVGRAPVGDETDQLSLLIAVGIGLHNFAEGLAIGQSAASGELVLALLLVIGFGLHNVVTQLLGSAHNPALPSPNQAVRPSVAVAALYAAAGGGCRSGLGWRHDGCAGW